MNLESWLRNAEEPAQTQSVQTERRRGRRTEFSDVESGNPDIESDGAWFSQGEVRTVRDDAGAVDVAGEIDGDEEIVAEVDANDSEPQIPDGGAAVGNGQLPNVQPARNRVKWGTMTGIDEIRAAVEDIHAVITTWRPNLFEVPKSQAGKDFVAEATRLLRLFNTRSAWENVAINSSIVFFPMMLQKPSSKSKPSDHSRYLAKRLTLWKEGKLKEIMSEAKEIQKRWPAQKARAKEEGKLRGFTRMMMAGKVKQALKLVDTDNVIAGVHVINDDIRDTLQAKHPEAAEADERALLDGDVPRVEEVIFEEINAKAIQASAKKTFGSGGPTRVDADMWKRILCSKAFGKLSDELADEVARMARRLCTEEIPHQVINLLFDARLVALRKEDDGVRPIGIGETLRRIVGKSVAKVTGKDVQLAGGLLQTCTGLEAGIEAAIHAMARTWEDEGCEAVLLVDAENAFNSLNRAAALHNTSRRCPSLHRYLQNSYQEPAKLHLGDGSFILSKEGVTQGDNEAMAIYAISTRGLQDDLRTAEPDVTQVWFADDNSGGGKIVRLKGYWDALKDIGPSYGYNPKASKSYLIVKDEMMRERAEEIFAGEGVQITVDGERHIGAALGSADFKTQYVIKKVDKWIQDVEELATIAEEEPQCALSAFNSGLSQRWSFLQRTVAGISELFNPLEDAIRQRLIPALIGRQVSELERRMLALPYRHGGLGMRNPVLTADREYQASVAVTVDLTNLIYQQETDLNSLDIQAAKEKKGEVLTTKEALLKNEAQEIAALLDEKQRKLFECASLILAVLPSSEKAWVRSQ